MQVALLRQGPAGLLPAGTRRPNGARSPFAARNQLRRRQRQQEQRRDDRAGVCARAGKGPSWLGGLAGWPSMDGNRKQEEEVDADMANGPTMRPINEVLGGGAMTRGGGDDGGADSDSDEDDEDGGQPPPDPLGPLAVLVVGLTADELAAFRAALHDIDADIVRLLPCPRSALLETGGEDLALEDAVALEACPPHEPAPDGTPAVVFLSGMSGPEVAEIVRCYREDPEPPLPPAAFCALVPGNRRRGVRGLVASIWRDEAKVRERWRLRQKQQLEEEEG